MMKRNDWVYLANAMWAYAEKHEGRVSDLLKELITKVNKNKEMIIDDRLEDDEPTVRIHKGQNTNSTSKIDSNRTR
jgi:hypothetical protein|tara:strand:+ start:1000 stop:1227 length:228 start_codon:yes stop_codon:yes gene_type:complete